jgi:hypothetical protein
MKLSDLVPVASLVFAIVPFIISVVVQQWTSKNEERRRKEEEQRRKEEERRVQEIVKTQAAREALIQALQGEKESIGFTALRLSREGVPQEDLFRNEVITALVQAAVFSGSDRARAMVYSVLRDNYHAYQSEIDRAIASVEDKFKQFEKYDLDAKELDLERGNRRLRALKTVVMEDRA